MDNFKSDILLSLQQNNKLQANVKQNIAELIFISFLPDMVKAFAALSDVQKKHRVPSENS